MSPWADHPEATEAGAALWFFPYAVTSALWRICAFNIHFRRKTDTTEKAVNGTDGRGKTLLFPCPPVLYLKILTQMK
jgi:hypothetical protein